MRKKLEDTIHGPLTAPKRSGKRGRPKRAHNVYRLQVYIRPEHKKWLDAASLATGVDQAVIVDALIGVQSVKLMSSIVQIIKEREAINADKLEKFG